MNLKNLFRRLVNLVSWVNKTNVLKDDQQFPMNQYSYMRKVKNIVVIYPYGMTANAPVNNLGVKINVGHEENAFAIEMSEDNRPKKLEPGEAAFGNWVKDTRIFFKADGGIEIISKAKIDIISEGDVNVTAPNVNVTADLTTINGNVKINGDLDVTGAIVGGTVATSGGVDLDTHVHLKEAVPPVVGQTGPPV